MVIEKNKISRKFKIGKPKFPQKTTSLPYNKLAFFSLLLSLFVVLFVFYSQNRLPPEVPLFYGMPEGEDVLIGPRGLLIPPVFAFFTTIINCTLALYLQSQFLKKALVFSTSVIAILSAITTIKIIFLVGNF